MQQETGQMVSAGPGAEELAVQHVRKPGEGVPIGRMAAGQRPGDPLGRQAVSDMEVLIHVFVVVAGDEHVLERLAEDEKDGQQQETGDGQPQVEVWRP